MPVSGEKGFDVDLRKIREFQRRILEWGKMKILDYPWRGTRDPYRILISEMLLHRTRAEQVVPVYRKFIKMYPSIEALSSSNFQEIERILRPLGLNWRIKHIYKMAIVVVEKFNSQIPESYEDLRSVPGVSDYIASAVRCFAFGYPEPVLDTNTVRIIGRVFGIRVRDSTRRNKSFRNFASKLVPRDSPELFNYALLDFGKIVCKARSPECITCVLKHICSLYREKKA